MRGMSLKDYITALPADQREAFALRCGTTVGHLNNVMYGYKTASPWFAVAIERETGSAIKRQKTCATTGAICGPSLLRRPRHDTRPRPTWRASFPVYRLPASFPAFPFRALCSLHQIALTSGNRRGRAPSLPTPVSASPACRSRGLTQCVATRIALC